MKDINSSLQVDALQNRVSPETEDVFNDMFWMTTDLVVNALDNVNARLYVDSRCVYFGKPLLESGTLGEIEILSCKFLVLLPVMYPCVITLEVCGRCEVQHPSSDSTPD